MKVGEIEVHSVLDGFILSKLPPSKPFPTEGSPTWLEQHGMLRPDDMIESTVGAFVVRAGDRLLLVDAGAGQAFPDGYHPPAADLDDPGDPVVGMFRQRGLPDPVIADLAEGFRRTDMGQGQLPASLAAIGVRPEDVTDVVLTHLHFDHIGWVSADGQPYFPNATIHCASADLDHFLHDEHGEAMVALIFQAVVAAERLAPVRDRIETWDGDRTLFPGIDVRLAPGHTPGSSVVVISDGTERAMLLGDVVHCPLELQDDDFNLLIDYDQELANRTREAYARELEGSNVRAAASHFPGLRFGRMLPGDGVRRWTFD
jgi:glyoxylase-like metal-dependent hydrolase (beta-lactamase superfamily II)